MYLQDYIINTKKILDRSYCRNIDLKLTRKLQQHFDHYHYNNGTFQFFYRDAFLENYIESLLNIHLTYLDILRAIVLFLLHGNKMNIREIEKN